ncbi:MAG: DUF5407 family protein [Solirubrobacteraceae bacterium]
MILGALWRRSLVALALGLAVPTVAEASGQTPPRLTPAQVHVVADEAGVVRGLLRIENSLTYDAVSARPSRRVLAARIRNRNQLVIGWCDAIIRDGARVSAAQRHSRRSHAVDASVDTADPSEAIKQATADVQARLELLKQQGEQISIVDMFEMQILMNKLSQLSEMSSSILSASNSAIASMARNVKS